MISLKAGLASLAAVVTAVGLLPSAAQAQQPAAPAAPATTTAAATTTHTAQTTNNTAACSAAGYGLDGTSYCGAAFAGWTDRSSPTGSSTQPLTQPHNPAVSGTWNISKGRGTQAGDVHSLLYAGNTTKVIAETQLWFCHGSGGSTVTVDSQVLTRYEACPNLGFSGSVSHFDNGYSSNDLAKADATADDMWDRGIDGVVEDWSGDPNTCKSGSGSYSNNAPFASACNSAGVTNVDLASKRLASAMDTRHPGMTHFIMYDDSAYKFTQCATKDTYQPQCVQNKMIADFNVLASNWFGDSGYLRINNQPVVASFVTETSGGETFTQCSTSNVCHLTGSYTCTSASGCWSALWDGIRSNFQNHGYNPYLIFRHNHTHEQSDGGFTWVAPSGGTAGTAADQDNWGNKTQLDSQLSTESSALASGVKGANGLPITYFAGAWKGFDDRMANWSPSWSNGTPVAAPVPSGNYPRDTSQRCGTNWLDTFAETGKYFSTSNQAPFLMVSTWDDYEEGSEVETGISNCVTSFTSSLAGSTLQWTIGLSGDGASERTVDHYTVWYSTDGSTGEQLAQLTTVAPTGTGTSASYSLNLSQYCASLPATSVLYVQAVGKPSITNHMTSGVTYANSCSGTTALSGQVTNLNTGGGIGGATVSISGPASASTTADASGNYSFSGIPAGTYTVTGTASGYKARSYSGVTVTSGQTTTQNVQLTTTGRVTGTVTGAGGVALSGATVTLQGGNLPTTDTVTTDASGAYASDWDPIGTYTVTCSAAGYADQTVSGVAITTGGLTTVNCTLSNTGTLTGVVTNLNTGGAISGATVSYSGGSTTSDSAGRYTFSGVTAGTYSITATASGYKSRTYSGVTVTAGQTTTQDVQLTTTGRVTGTVTSGGTAVSGATITLQGGNLPTTDTVTSDSTGHYTSNWDPIGTYTVTCSAPGHGTQTISGVQITTGGLTTVNCQI
ncbi:MAG TPA: carboxypeptidase regulatory-like domain-containing protein [Jatrophihabitans sp.]|nr:carboxypeptidase regulatory-like domain-containing protein [Jatrophihabitans sp.]